MTKRMSLLAGVAGLSLLAGCQNPPVSATASTGQTIHVPPGATVFIGTPPASDPVPSVVRVEKKSRVIVAGAAPTTVTGGAPIMVPPGTHIIPCDAECIAKHVGVVPAQPPGVRKTFFWMGKCNADETFVPEDKAKGTPPGCFKLEVVIPPGRPLS